MKGKGYGGSGVVGGRDRGLQVGTAVGGAAAGKRLRCQEGGAQGFSRLGDGGGAGGRSPRHWGSLC